MEDRIPQFSKLLLDIYIDFLKFYSIAPSAVSIDEIALYDISKRYFKDVERLHKYHNIQRIDAHKIAGYITYWIAKLKPISIKDKKVYSFQAEFFLYINEFFAIYVAMGRLVASNHLKKPIKTDIGLLTSLGAVSKRFL